MWIEIFHVLLWSSYVSNLFLLFAGNRNQAEVSQTCRGTIIVENVEIQTGVGCNFVLTSGAARTFHLRATTEVERQRWVTALELARTKARSFQDSGECIA